MGQSQMTPQQLKVTHAGLLSKLYIFNIKAAPSYFRSKMHLQAFVLEALNASHGCRLQTVRKTMIMI